MLRVTDDVENRREGDHEREQGIHRRMPAEPRDVIREPRTAGEENGIEQVEGFPRRFARNFRNQPNVETTVVRGDVPQQLTAVSQQFDRCHDREEMPQYDGGWVALGGLDVVRPKRQYDERDERDGIDDEGQPSVASRRGS